MCLPHHATACEHTIHDLGDTPGLAFLYPALPLFFDWAQVHEVSQAWIEASGTHYAHSETHEGQCSCTLEEGGLDMREREPMRAMDMKAAVALTGLLHAAFHHLLALRGG